MSAGFDLVSLAVVEFAEIKLVLTAVHIPEHCLVGISEAVTHGFGIIYLNVHTEAGVAVAVHFNGSGCIAFVEVSAVVLSALRTAQSS